jgi:hypothetical protein
MEGVAASSGVNELIHFTIASIGIGTRTSSRLLVILYFSMHDAWEDKSNLRAVFARGPSWSSDI